ncbi:FadR/GntR family transcriptional regulator [Mycobacterium sp. C31M]
MVASALRRDIIRNELFDGDLLPTEADLMARFGVSRPSLREALRILESEKLVVVRRGNQGGVRACRPSVSVAANYLGLVMQAEQVTLADVFAARVAIEPEAVRLLAGLRNRSQAVAELSELLEREGQLTDDVDAYPAATFRFHQRLVELSGNKTLALLWGTLQYVLAGEMRDIGTGFTPKQRALRVKSIRRAFALIEAGEAEAAAEFWRHELAEAGKRVIQRHGAKTVVDVLG